MRLGDIVCAAIVAALLAACGPGTLEDCNNGNDDDGDGLVDFDDPNCAGECMRSASAETEEETGEPAVCRNGVDEDCDGDVDCDDADCAGAPECLAECIPAAERETGAPGLCTNVDDDDCDGLVDCDDSDCVRDPACLQHIAVDPALIDATHVVGTTECPQELAQLTFSSPGVTVRLAGAPPGVSLSFDGTAIPVGGTFDGGAEVLVAFDCASTDDVSGELVFELIVEGEVVQTTQVPVTIDVVSETPAPRTYPTIGAPEGIALFAPNATFAPAGLVTGRPYAVVSSAAGGADLIELETGDRTTSSWLGAAYGVVPFRDVVAVDPEMFVFYGPTNVAYTYWDASAVDFGFTSLSSGSNVTDVDIGPHDDAGVPTAQVYVHNGGPWVSVLRSGESFATAIDGAVFPGGAYPGSPVSGAFSPDASALAILFENGELYFGPELGPMTLVGTTGTDVRLMECERTLSPTRVCAAEDYGGDETFLIEVTDSGAEITGSLPTGDGPVEPALIANGADVVIASTGTNDASLHLFRYSIDTQLLESVGTTTLEGCAGPGHSRFLAVDDLVVSCNGSDLLLRLDPFAAVGATP